MEKLKDILISLGIEFDAESELNPEAYENTILEHINNLEKEKETLSQANQELSASVEGEKADKEKLAQELSETKTELASTKGKLEQVTEMYKEHFSKDPEEDEETKDDKKLGNDVLQMILDTK